MPNNRAKFIIILILIIIGFLIIAFPIEAALNWSNREAGIATTAGKAGIAKVDWLVIATAAISAVLGLVGMIFLVLIIYGGFLWMAGSKGGKDKEINKAKQLIVSAVIGLAIVTMAYAITYFVSRYLEPGQQAPGGGGGNMNVEIW